MKLVSDLGFSEAMGPRLRRFVEEQLLGDLARHGVAVDGLVFDWSESCPEGHRTAYLDGELENWSGVAVLDAGGRPVAGGWLDFVQEGDAPPVVYWDDLSVAEAGSWRYVKRQPGVPPHVWERLPDSARARCRRDTEWDTTWWQDPLGHRKP
jgi:hypothetical protein